MPTVIRGSDNIDTGNVATQTELDDKITATGDAPIFGCRAWVNFDGTKDSTGAASTANTARLIRASGNVDSVMRNGVGDYTVNFITAMVDDGYAPLITASGDFAPYLLKDSSIWSLTSSSCRIVTGAGSSETLLQDRSILSVSIFR